MQYFPMDFVNGPGLRCTLFVSGCTHKCKGCFSPASHDFKAGFAYTKALEDEIIRDLKNTKIPRKGLSILGGEPLHEKNIKSIYALIKRVRLECQKADIWLWSGYVYENLNKEQLKLVKNIDVLVDGPFIEGLKDANLKFKGSKNQRLIATAKGDLLLLD